MIPGDVFLVGLSALLGDGEFEAEELYLIVVFEVRLCFSVTCLSFFLNGSET